MALAPGLPHGGGVHQFLNFSGVLVVAVLVQYNRTGLHVFAVPLALGLIVLLASVIVRYQCTLNLLSLRIKNKSFIVIYFLRLISYLFMCSIQAVPRSSILKTKWPLPNSSYICHIVFCISPLLDCSCSDNV